MLSPLPYRITWNRPVLLIVVLVLLSWTLPVYATREAEVEASMKRIRHGPVIPAAPTELKSTFDQDATYELHKRRNSDNGNRDANTGNYPNNHEPYGIDPQRSSHSNTLNGERRDAPAPVPEYTPIVTPAPDQEAVLASQGYKQITYYTCNTIGGNEHCGWHVPIVKAQGVRRDSGTVWMVVGCLAGVFALGLM
ncbi:hypothetical protein VFPPC_18147 [Pochonia chlamydosporia 170]|uniref:Uncharacterized protein n=1 Tax=Pochonia chlamydosporia 170 TaxID=1380566 RepID=A0A219AQZ3_METCM|nr:hypothetical protein VFPPC_18147 [Pochonia chlamydosporia 170]OWT42734.1 hypothetical protein VFPPC_18147 [Pochonia chlamydosporia 170]